MSLTNNQLQYILREVFNEGISMWTSHIYKSENQISTAITTLRKKLLDLNRGSQEYFFWFLRRPGSFSMPDETSYFLGFKDLVKIDRDFYPDRASQRSEEIISEEDLMQDISGCEVRGVRALLNSRLFLLHPECFLSLEEWKKNPYSPWESKFPIEKGTIIDTDIEDNQIYGEIDASVGEVFAQFLGTMGKDVSPEEIRKLNRKIRLPKH